MEVYALVGKSGTGKSYQAMNLCKEKGIESIIDDGLYIYRSKVLAGRSAKREATKIGAVKTALFNKDEHRDEVVAEIKRTEPETILLLGTSDGMVNKIAARLDLPDIGERTCIEEITTEGERRVAYKQRHIQGKHVIPAPTFQIKRHFSGLFIDPLRILKEWGFPRHSYSDKSVVRPTYSYLGEFIIADKAIHDIIESVGEEFEGRATVLKMSIGKISGELELDLVVLVNPAPTIVDVCTTLQKRTIEVLEEMTAFSVKRLNIDVRGMM